LFHSSLSLAPSSLFTAAHSGEMFVAVSLGGSCCFRGLFLGDGSRLGVAITGPALASSTISEEMAEIVEEPLDSGRGGESCRRAVPLMCEGGSPRGVS